MCTLQIGTNSLRRIEQKAQPLYSEERKKRNEQRKSKTEDRRRKPRVMINFDHYTNSSRQTHSAHSTPTHAEMCLTEIRASEDSVGDESHE